MNFLMLAFLQASMIHSAPNPPGWRHFTNVRYAFSLCYPASFAPQDEPANGDGRAFVARDGARIAVWGRNDPDASLGASLQEDIRRLGGTSGRITYRAVGRGWSALSGVNGERLFYVKSLLRTGQGGTQMMTLQITHSRRKAKFYQPIVERVSRCFKIAPDAPG